MQIYRRYPDQDGSTDIRKLSDERLVGQNPPTLDLTKPTLFYFPGFQTVDNGTIYNSNAEQSLNLKSSVIESHIRNVSDKYKDGSFNFVTLTYSPERLLTPRMREKLNLPEPTSRSGRLFDAATFMWRPKKYYRQDAQDFTDQMIMPAITKEDKSLKSKGEIADAFRNLTFFGDSYGSTFAHQVGNYLKYRLSNKQFPDHLSKTDADELIKNIVFIGASNIVKTDKDNRFSGIYFEGNNDKFIEMARKMRNIKELVLDNWRKGRELPEVIEGVENKVYQKIRTISDNGAFEMRGEFDHIIDAAPKDYRSTPKQSKVKLERVDKGFVVHFNVPEKYVVMLRQGTRTIARYYENPERHQSYSYFYVVPECRDHADLLGRVLRNAVSVGKMGARTADTLLNPELPNANMANVERENYRVMNRHLNGIIASSLPEYKAFLTQGIT